MIKSKLGVFISFFYFSIVFGEDFNIVGFFETGEDPLNKKAFDHAVEYVNEVWQEIGLEHKLVPLSAELEPENTFPAINTACENLAKGIIGVFGPRSLNNVYGVQSVCDAKEIPQVLGRWIYNPQRSDNAINFYPHSELLIKAYKDIITAWDWKTFTVLYEDDESLLRLSDLIITSKQDKIIVTLEQLDKERTKNYRPALKRVWKTGQKFFVLDCHIDNLMDVLTQAQQVGLMTSDYNYLITNLDAHTKDLTPFQFSETNITGIRILNPERREVQTIAYKIFNMNREENEEEVFDLEAAAKLGTETALIYDSVIMFAQVFYEKLSALEDPSTLIGVPIDCQKADRWGFGYSLVNLIRSTKHKGLTGHIEFNAQGHRSSFGLQVYELREGGVIDVANWNSTTGLNLTIHPPEPVEIDYDSLRNKTFKIIITLTEPYGMRKETPETLVGNDRYEGFSMDLIQELANLEGFNYTFIVQEDGKNGEKEKDGRWSGMLGKVIEGEADMAITDLTITADRASAVDFTSPFMSLGISILFQKPQKAPPNFFSFAEPFAFETWVALALAFFVVSLSYFLLGRICPDEWNNPYPCVEEPEFLINQFSFTNSVWFATGAMLQQGSEMAPVAIPTRLVSGVWWFFVLIMVASYTANLASFLVTENTIPLFSDVRGLVEKAQEQGIRFGAKEGGATYSFFEKENTIPLFSDVRGLVEKAQELGIRFGAKEGGATYSFFEKSEGNPVYQKIAKHMREHKEDMPTSNEKGIGLVENNRYAFFMESTSIDYTIQRHCNLTIVGDRLDEKGYGIALRKNSPFRTRLSTAILKLQSSGVIDKIRKKWWEERKGGGQCADKDDDAEATPLDLENVEGIFYVTIFGTILGAVIVIFEYIISIMKISKKVKVPFKEALKQELKFFIKFGSNVKPVLGAVPSEEENVDEKSVTKSVSNKSRKSKSRSELSKITNENDAHSGKEYGNGTRAYGFVVPRSQEDFS